MSLILFITAQLAFGMDFNVDVFKFTAPAKKIKGERVETEVTECYAYIYIDKLGEFKKMFWRCPDLQGGLYGKIY